MNGICHGGRRQLTASAGGALTRLGLPPRSAPAAGRRLGRRQRRRQLRRLSRRRPEAGGLNCFVGGCDLGGSQVTALCGMSPRVLCDGSDLLAAACCGLSCVGARPEAGVGYLGSGRRRPHIGSISGSVDGLHPSGRGGPSYLDACRRTGRLGRRLRQGRLGPRRRRLRPGSREASTADLAGACGEEHGTSPAGILELRLRVEPPGPQRSQLGLRPPAAATSSLAAAATHGGSGLIGAPRDGGVRGSSWHAPMATAVTAALAARTVDMASADPISGWVHTAPDITAVCASRSAPATQRGPIQPVTTYVCSQTAGHTAIFRPHRPSAGR